MPAYVIANVEITDPDAYREYSDQVSNTIAAHGGRYLARGGETRALEGAWVPHRLVLLEFPSFDAAEAWFGSPEYEKIKPIRLQNARTQLLLTDGVPAAEGNS